MTHISKRVVSTATLKQIDELILASFTDTGTKERQQIFRELLTKTERLMLAKRLAMLSLIQKNVSTFHISRLLQVSPSTVARFEVEVDQGKYRHTSAWLSTYRKLHKILRLLANLTVIPFQARRNSFAKIVNESW